TERRRLGHAGCFPPPRTRILHFEISDELVERVVGGWTKLLDHVLRRIERRNRRLFSGRHHRHRRWNLDGFGLHLRHRRRARLCLRDHVSRREQPSDDWRLGSLRRDCLRHRRLLRHGSRDGGHLLDRHRALIAKPEVLSHAPCDPAHPRKLQRVPERVQYIHYFRHRPTPPT